MKIFDCFMFYDEELLLDIRMNILNNFYFQKKKQILGFYHLNKKYFLKLKNYF